MVSHIILHPVLYPKKSKHYVILDRSCIYYLFADLLRCFTKKDQEITEQ